jgi:hypothetical protein
MPQKLSNLVCGCLPQSPQGLDSDLRDILKHVGDSLDYMVDEVEWLANQNDQRVASLGPFLGRSLLELGVTALIGRLDPMRLLVVRRVQQQPDYDTRDIWNSSIRWRGDVIADKVHEPWGAKRDYPGMTKALLGDYYNELFWRAAITSVLDLKMEEAPGLWLSELKSVSAESFISRKRTEISQLYSALSKGVHHEFVLPPGAVYDRTTVRDLFQRAFHCLADLAFVSHFIPHTPYCLGATEAIAALGELETVEVFK